MQNFVSGLVIIWGAFFPPAIPEDTLQWRIQKFRKGGSATGTQSASKIFGCHAHFGHVNAVMTHAIIVVVRLASEFFKIAGSPN